MKLSNIVPLSIIGLLFGLLYSSCASANAGIPMLGVALPGMLFALVPIVIAETFVVAIKLSIGVSESLTAISVANMASTLIGIPLTWSMLVILQFKTNGTGNYWPTTTGQKIFDAIFHSAWLNGEGDPFWRLPVACLVLLVPFFFVSWLVEYFVVKWVLDSVVPDTLGDAVLVANLLSYAGLAVAVIWITVIDFHDYQEKQETKRTVEYHSEEPHYQVVLVATLLVILTLSAAAMASEPQLDKGYESAQTIVAEVVDNSSGISSEMVGFFSDNYSEARKKFLLEAASSGARIESFEHPVKAPSGEPIYTDIAMLGAQDASTTLVISSGTHGVEGFAGSGIQTGLLRSKAFSRIPSHMRVFLVHAINPYGFSHLRRVNEDNVDLNRNFVDHSKPYPKNKGYAELADTIAPKSISHWENFKSFVRLSWYVFKNSMSDLKLAISGGQYTHPTGLFYGGHSEAWSNHTIKYVVKQYMPNAERVILIDIHTGLGPYGAAEVIMGAPKSSPDYVRAKGIWGERVKNPVSGDSVSVAIQGPIKLAFSQLFTETEVTSVTLEFGTFSRWEVFSALRSENWLHHHGSHEYPERKKIKERLLRAFYPDDDQWQLQIWHQGNEVVEKALKHLRGTS